MIGTKARRISNSSLSWVKLGPRVFKMMWDRELRQSSTRSLDLGSAIHCYLLEPDRFATDYVILNNVETVEGKMGDFIRGVHQLKLMKLPGEDITDEEFGNMAKVVGFKIDLKRIISNYYDPKYAEYIDALEKAHGRMPINEQDMNTITSIAHGVQNHKLADKLLNDNSLFTQNEINMEGIVEAKYMPLPSVAILDRLIIDHEAKKVYFVDLKTTSGSVYLFRESYEKYNYRRQMSFYREHVRQLYPGYSVECFIIAIQTSYVNHTADIVVYSIDEMELAKGELEYQPLLDTVSWHMKHDIWDYPQEYHESHGACLLNLIT